MASKRAITNVDNVAAYILEKHGPMSAMKLQKLAYYAQAWSLVWNERPLFSRRIEAWANGPVVPYLYRKHRGEFIVQEWPDGEPGSIPDVAKDTIDRVVDFYGKQSPVWLSELTHMERPWKEARRGLPPGERSDREITHASMAEYYESLL